MINQLNEATRSFVVLNRFTGRYGKMISISGTRDDQKIVQLDASRLHETELFLRINEEFRSIRDGDTILITNCPRELGEDVGRWSKQRDAITHYCTKNKAVAIGC
ncbi:MAG: hypothetical protein IME93_06800 [Proteobacteria bacterium]|nr:hypothetical protein [Pseudomonadota bacterium]